MIKKAFLLGLLVAGCQMPLSSHELADCDHDIAVALENTSGEIYFEKEFILNTDVPSQGSGGQAYFINEKLRKLRIQYFGEIGKKEVDVFFPLDEDFSTYQLIVKSYIYDKPLGNVSSSGSIKGRVCSGNLHTSSIELQNDFPGLELDIGRAVSISNQIF